MDNLLPTQGELLYVPQFIDQEVRTSFFDQLMSETQWQKRDIKLFGKMHPQPRLVSWVANPGLDYSYSGLQLLPDPWTKTLLVVKEKVEMFSKSEFNSVLLNLYRNENDSNGWHSDDEKELGLDPVIASVSLGEERDFLLKHKQKKELKLKIKLESGSLVLMKGETQKFWKHSIPKRSKKLGPRINLTFRKIVTT